MKKLTFVLMVFAMLSPAHAYEKRMRHIVEQLRSMEEIGGSAVGYAGTPHDFYLLYRYAAYASTDQDILDMMRDANPVVRIMGVKCALTAPFRNLDLSLLEPVVGDERQLLVGPGGCVFQKMTVSDVIAALKKDPNYLGDGVFKKRPNQTPEPTPTAVTIPADAGLAPAAVVAHL